MTILIGSLTHTWQGWLVLILLTLISIIGAIDIMRWCNGDME